MQAKASFDDEVARSQQEAEEAKVAWQNIQASFETKLATVRQEVDTAQATCAAEEIRRASIKTECEEAERHLAALLNSCAEATNEQTAAQLQAVQAKASFDDEVARYYNYYFIDYK